MGGGLVSASPRPGVTIWEWNEDIEDGYVVWRLELDGSDEQLCMYDNGMFEVRGYDAVGEECWNKVYRRSVTDE